MKTGGLCRSRVRRCWAATTAPRTGAATASHGRPAAICLLPKPLRVTSPSRQLLVAPGQFGMNVHTSDAGDRTYQQVFRQRQSDENAFGWLPTTIASAWSRFDHGLT